MRVLITIVAFLLFFLTYYCIEVSVLALFLKMNWVKLFFDSDMQLGTTILLNWWIAGLSTYEVTEDLWD